MSFPIPAAVGLLAVSLAACSPAPPPAAPKAPGAPAAAAAPTPAAPAKKTVMVCRNSQTGAKAECGTPNAVMVGMKTE
ncbi:MAG TPA: hypothetical protein VG166_08935 [Caulobacteraceae bacterium]|nr:hypothetical protein [Caulobacteraceae bacterium]